MRTKQHATDGRTRFTALVGGILAACVLLPAAAHHSFAMYDREAVRTLTGKLTRFVPSANHAQLYFELVGADGKVVMEGGKPVVWGAETGGAAMLAKRGITGQSFPLGSIITVNVHPLRDGRTFGVLAQKLEFVIKCGMELPTGGCTRETGQIFDVLND